MLKGLLEEVLQYRRLLGKVDKRRDSRVVDALISSTQLDAQALRTPEFLALQAMTLKSALSAAHPNETLVLEVAEDPEHGCQKITVRMGHNGAMRETSVDHVLLAGPAVPQRYRLRRELVPLVDVPHSLPAHRNSAPETI